MTDRELVDALRNTTSRSKRKLLNAAADRIEAAVDFETATNGEMICGIPLQDYRNTFAITRGGVLNSEVLPELRRMHEQQLAAEDRLRHNRRALKRLLMQFMADLKKNREAQNDEQKE